MQLSPSNFRSIQEIPPPYSNIFGDYPCFNIVQSAVLDDALKTDTSLVVTAPTGSGKTALFELAIVRQLMLLKEFPETQNFKIVYISPMKALCKERLVDWHKKFSDFGVKCTSITSDAEDFDTKNIQFFNLIISTPEKWDVVTRKWRENPKFIESIGLFLIDEVHLLNTDTRGPTLEVIVSRMKTAIESIRLTNSQFSIRFIALSATIPNIEDIAEWLDGPSGPTKFFKFPEGVRPVELTKLVLGYYNPQNQSAFKFDMSLTYKLPSLILKYSQGKPTLIFCSTRKCVEMTADHLVSNLQIHLSSEQKRNLAEIAQQISDSKLKQHIVHGIAFHHAGLMQENRFTIEESFRHGHIPVLVTTSTLAMGVNLPAHLVIVKSTKYYSENGYQDLDQISMFQMVGRAGRSQFDTSATALILTTMQDKTKYERMLECNQMIESNLHKHLTEHLNAEVVLKTITDLEVAVRWLSSTFLYVRARKSPEKYKLPVGLSKEKLDKKLLEICQTDLDKLVKAGMAVINEATEIRPTTVGEIMAKFYVAFDTMKLFTQMNGTENLSQLLCVISKSKEFSEIYLRSSDKACLNLLNKNSKKESNRFPLNGRISNVNMKINCIIQAILGNLEIHNQSIVCDSIRVMRNCQRLGKCLIEYLETRNCCYAALLNATILVKCFHVKLWENSPYLSKQLSGVGQVMSTLLAKAGKNTFKEIANTNPRNIEMIIGKKAPIGNTIVEEAVHLPQYSVSLNNGTEEVTVVVTLLNADDIAKRSTVALDAMMTLLMGDSNNNVLIYEKYTHSYMVENPIIQRSLEIKSNNLRFIEAHFISDNWVGIDSSFKLKLIDEQNTNNKTPKANKQTSLDNYMAKVKKISTPFTEKGLRRKDSTIKKLINLPIDNATSNNPSSGNSTNVEGKVDTILGSNKETVSSNQAKDKGVLNNKSLLKQKSDFWSSEENIDSIPDSVLVALLDDFINDNNTELEGSKSSDGKIPPVALQSSKLKPRSQEMDDSKSDLQETPLSVDKLETSSAGKICILEHKIIPPRPADQAKGLAIEEFNEGLLQNNDYQQLYTKYFPQKALKEGDDAADSTLGEKTNMSYPDSTVTYDLFGRKNYNRSHCDRINCNESKTIKWKSPLVQSSPQLFRMNKLATTCDSKEEIKENLITRRRYRPPESSSPSSHNSSASDAYSKIAEGSRKKPRFKLKDDDYASERSTPALSNKSNDLNDICDLDYYGLSNMAKKDYSSRGYVGKYYNELLTNSQRKLETASPKRIPTPFSASKSDVKNEAQIEFENRFDGGERSAFSRAPQYVLKEEKPVSQMDSYSYTPRNDFFDRYYQPPSLVPHKYPREDPLFKRCDPRVRPYPEAAVCSTRRESYCDCCRTPSSIRTPYSRVPYPSFRDSPFVNPYLRVEEGVPCCRHPANNNYGFEAAPQRHLHHDFVQSPFAFTPKPFSPYDSEYLTTMKRPEYDGIFAMDSPPYYPANPPRFEKFNEQPQAPKPELSRIYGFTPKKQLKLSPNRSSENRSPKSEEALPSYRSNYTPSSQLRVLNAEDVEERLASQMSGYYRNGNYQKRCHNN